jgi:uncharacterized membrane protein
MLKRIASGNASYVMALKLLVAALAATVGSTMQTLAAIAIVCALVVLLCSTTYLMGKVIEALDYGCRR